MMREIWHNSFYSFILVCPQRAFYHGALMQISVWMMIIDSRALFCHYRVSCVLVLMGLNIIFCLSKITHIMGFPVGHFSSSVFFQCHCCCQVKTESFFSWHFTGKRFVWCGRNASDVKAGLKMESHWSCFSGIAETVTLSFLYCDLSSTVCCSK